MDGFIQYQRQAAETAVYPGPGETSGLAYVSLGLVGEAGEVANKVKKILRDADTPERRAAVAEELGDVLWYTAMLATELGVDLGQVAALNLAKLESRALRGTLRGDGDRR